MQSHNTLAHHMNFRISNQNDKVIFMKYFNDNRIQECFNIINTATVFSQLTSSFKPNYQFETETANRLYKFAIYLKNLHAENIYDDTDDLIFKLFTLAAERFGISINVSADRVSIISSTVNSVSSKMNCASAILYLIEILMSKENTKENIEEINQYFDILNDILFSDHVIDYVLQDKKYLSMNDREFLVENGGMEFYNNNKLSFWTTLKGVELQSQKFEEKVEKFKVEHNLESNISDPSPSHKRRPSF